MVYRRLFKKGLYILYLFFVVCILLEIGLRIYNPFHFRLKGDKIVLPVSRQTIITNRINPKLDSIIINTRNSIGFRGPEPPAGKTANTLSVITIGGSTTECHFLSDNKTWPFILQERLSASFSNIWLNNAGMDGHSSFGHLVMLNDYVKKMHPDIVLFLVGINDVESEQPGFHDKLNTRGAYTDILHYLFENSEVLNLVLNIARGGRAQHLNNTTHKMFVLNNNNQLNPDTATVEKRLAAQKKYLTSFRERLQQLADTCFLSGIIPVFITQPNQFGAGIDSVTGANLELYKLGDNINGKLEWRMLELYNDVTRSTGLQKKIPVIDLARLLPKNSRYFYDNSHFTNDGAEKVASLISAELIPILLQRFPSQKK